MKGKPTDATHTIDLAPARSGQLGAVRLYDLAHGPLGQKAVLPCHVCGEEIAIPGGSVKDYLLGRAAQFGGPDAYISFGTTHTWNTCQPMGTTLEVMRSRGQNPRLLSQVTDEVVFENPDPSLPPEAQSDKRRNLKDIFKQKTLPDDE